MLCSQCHQATLHCLQQCLAAASAPQLEHQTAQHAQQSRGGGGCAFPGPPPTPSLLLLQQPQRRGQQHQQRRQQHSQHPLPPAHALHQATHERSSSAGGQPPPCHCCLKVPCARLCCRPAQGPGLGCKAGSCLPAQGCNEGRCCLAGQGAQRLWLQPQGQCCCLHCRGQGHLGAGLRGLPGAALLARLPGWSGASRASRGSGRVGSG